MTGGCGLLLAANFEPQDAARPDAGASDRLVADTSATDLPVADSSASTEAGGADWYDTTYRCRRKLSIDIALISEQLTDFPLLVELDASLLSCHGMIATPESVLFVDLDQVTELDFEVELDRSPISVTLWVRKPQLNPFLLDEHIWLYFGAEDIADNSRPQQTWSEAFRGVWHLSTSPAAQSHVSDSTAGAHHALVQSMDGSNVAQGQAGGALSFDGTYERLQIADHPDLDFGATSFTYSLWVNVIGNRGDYDCPWHKGGSDSTFAGYDIELGDDDWNAWISDGSDVGIVSFGDSGYISSGWHSLTVVVDRSDEQLRAYLDGELSDQSSIASIRSVSSNLDAYIGSDAWRAYPFHGYIDEVRVEAGARTAGWIEANQRNLVGELLQVGELEQTP